MQQPAFLKDWADQYDARRDLRRRMTRRVGVSLRQRPTPDQLTNTRAAMSGCNACQRTRECRAWLERGGAQIPPAFCPIGDLLVRMQAA